MAETAIRTPKLAHFTEQSWTYSPINLILSALAER